MTRQRTDKQVALIKATKELSNQADNVILNAEKKQFILLPELAMFGWRVRNFLIHSMKKIVKVDIILTYEDGSKGQMCDRTWEPFDKPELPTVNKVTLSKEVPNENETLNKL